jgi:glycosyltransferase involved in cell wall biosynthesis
VSCSAERLIAINAAVVGERPTGLSVFASNLIDALAGLGERLLVYTSRPQAGTAPGVDVRRIPAAVRPSLGVRGHAARLLWTQTGLRARVRHDRPTLLLHPVPDGLFFPPVPQIATVQDLVPLRFADQYPRQRHYFRYYVPALLRDCQAVLTISEAARRDVVSFYGVPPARVFVAPCGYDPRHFNPEGPGEAGEEPYALYVGNVMPHKNLLRLVEAFARATPGGRGRLRIRGWGQARHVRALRERIARLGLEPRVDWQPYATAEALPPLYRGARMLLLPSLAEGFGLTALEAMACGTPVVTSNTSAMPEVVGDAALLVDPLDTGGLAEAIARVFSDDRLVKDLRERGLARAPQFTWARTGRAAQAAIDAALGR